MIAKSISYAHIFEGVTKFPTADRKALLTSWAVARYVLGLSLDEREIALLQDIGQIGRYGHDDHGDSLRIEDTAIFNLEEGDLEDQAREFAYRVAAAGQRSLRQIIVAYGDEQIPDEMATRHRDIFRHLLRAETKPMIYSKHGDTDYDHFHLAICVADSRTGKVGDWGQGMEIEALHIASAICEAQDNLQCEPNRRYVADATGVYHTWSGMKVAEANGDIINRGAFSAMRAEQVEFDLEVSAPEGTDAGTPLPTATAIKLLARGVIRRARNWDDLHRGLARVGVRYEPSYAAGEVTGGNLVADNVRDKEDDRITASTVNAGYARLRTRFGDAPYEAPADDIRVRQFVAPAYRRGEPDISEDPSQDLEQLRQAERELQEFEDAQRARLDATLRALDEEALARRKLETREAKFRHHNQQQMRAKASREEAEEILRALRLAFEREAGKQRKGRPPKTKPIYMAVWGDTSNDPAAAPPEPGSWAKRYEIETAGTTRTFRLGRDIAFVETAGFVAVHADDRQSRIDALRRAHEKFGSVRVVGTPRFRREMLLLAAELDIPLDARQAKQAQELLAKAVAGRRRDEVVVLQRASPVNQVRAKPTKSPEEFADDRARQQRCELFDQETLREFRERNGQEDREARSGKPGTTKEVVAHRFLTTLDCDQLLLCASRYDTDDVRFLDDEKLLEKFAKLPQALVRSQVQQRLEAIRRVQQAKRDWILSGLATRQFEFRGDQLTIPDRYGDWPRDFMRGQLHDPDFARQVREAAAGSYSGKTVDLTVRPEIRAWREAGSGSADDQALARCIVDEWMRVTSDQDREAIFKDMKFDEAEKLRRTPGLAAEAYRGFHYRRDGESDRQWQRRKRTAQLNDRQRGR